MTLLAVLLLATACSAITIKNLVDIVTEVKQHFRSGCVFLLHDRDNDLRQHVTSKAIVNQLMKAHVSIVASFTPQLPEALQTMNCRHNKPLFVFPYGEQMDRYSLFQISTMVRMSKATWLLFLDTQLLLEEFFLDTYIPFDCEFLVVQEAGNNAVLLTEVYRIKSELPLQTCLFGTWTSPSGLTWPNINLHRRRDNLQGITLKTAFSKPYKKAEMLERNGPSGFQGELWQLLEKEINFTTEYHFPEDENSGGSKLPNGTWTGVFGMFQRNEVDVTNLVLTMLSTRMDVLDYTVPTLETRSYVFIRTPSTYELRWNMFRSFSPRLWIAIGLTMALLSLCFATMNTLALRYGLLDDGDCNTTKAVLIVFGAFCQKGDNVTPRTYSRRLAFVTLYVTSFMLLSYYSAAFVTDVTLQEPALPFTNFKELLDDGTYMLWMMRKSAQMDFFKESKKNLIKNIYRKLIAPHESTLIFSDVEGLQRLCHLKKYAYVTSQYNLLKEGYAPNCSISRINHTFFVGLLAVAMAKGSPYLGLFNYKLQNMRRVGILKNMYNRFSRKLRYAEDDIKPSVNLHDTAQIFVILVTGILLSLIIFTASKYGSLFRIPWHYISRHQITSFSVTAKSYKVTKRRAKRRQVKPA